METISSKACVYYPALFEEIEKYASSLEEIKYLFLMDKEAFDVVKPAKESFLRRVLNWIRSLGRKKQQHARVITPQPTAIVHVPNPSPSRPLAQVPQPSSTANVAKDITSAIEQAQQSGGLMNMHPLLAAGLGAGLVGLPGIAMATSRIKDDAEARARRAALAAGGAGFVGGLLSSRFLNNLANRYSATYDSPPGKPILLRVE